MTEPNSLNIVIQRINECSEREQVKSIVDDLDRRFIAGELAMKDDDWAVLSRAVATWIYNNG